MGKEICKAENHRYWKDRLRTEDQYRRAKKLGLVWDGEYTNNTFREGAGWVWGGGGWLTALAKLWLRCVWNRWVRDRLEVGND